jgi:hypothetical protein
VIAETGPSRHTITTIFPVLDVIAQAGVFVADAKIRDRSHASAPKRAAECEDLADGLPSHRPTDQQEPQFA